MRRRESSTFAIPEWETPAWLFEGLDAEFHFTRDVAAQPWNAKVAQYFTPDEDALEQPWDGVCWLNPPYGTGLEVWLAKAWAAAQCGATVVVLVPARTDASWFHAYGLLADELRFIRGRVNFSGAGRAPFASIVLVFRRARAGAFPRIAVIDPSNDAPPLELRVGGVTERRPMITSTTRKGAIERGGTSAVGRCLACGAGARSLFATALCDPCAEQLPLETIRRLTLRDADASNRLFQLLSALRRDVAIGEITVSA